jgi:hypothetical protein
VQYVDQLATMSDQIGVSYYSYDAAGEALLHEGSVDREYFQGSFLEGIYSNGRAFGQMGNSKTTCSDGVADRSIYFRTVFAFHGLDGS